MKRFERQMSLPEIGHEGQRKLTAAKVLVVGAGGLGCPVLQYLAAAGVGTLGIVDGDVISESNLNRQILFGFRDVGKLKAPTAATFLKERYPDINFRVHPEFLINRNTIELFSGYDLIVDGTDNFGTRYLINDACVLLEKPFVLGAIFKYEGQVGVFNSKENPVNYRDMYPTPPNSDEVPNCNETGVIGTLPGLIGILQATEVIKFITGVGNTLAGKILYYNLKSAEFFQVSLTPNLKAEIEMPGSTEEFLKKNYDIKCGIPDRISWREVIGNLEEEESVLIDIREPGEEPIFLMRSVFRIPMKDLKLHPDRLAEVKQIFLFCKSGARSDNLALFLKQVFPKKKIYSVEGGILDRTSPIFIDYEAKTKKYIH